MNNRHNDGSAANVIILPQPVYGQPYPQNTGYPYPGQPNYYQPNHNQQNSSQPVYVNPSLNQPQQPINPANL